MLGHAVLHHLPDLHRAFDEFHRVLAPGGVILFAGEPSTLGDTVARAPKQVARLLAPAWRAALRIPAATTAIANAARRRTTISWNTSSTSTHSRRMTRRRSRAGRFSDVRVRGEELTANWFGWFNRVLEASADRDRVPILWRRYAFHGYLAFQRLDVAALEPHLPPAIFYNLMLSARRGPGDARGRR